VTVRRDGESIHGVQAIDSRKTDARTARWFRGLADAIIGQTIERHEWHFLPDLELFSNIDFLRHIREELSG